jgi:hypothetical protein
MSSFRKFFRVQQSNSVPLVGGWVGSRDGLDDMER